MRDTPETQTHVHTCAHSVKQQSDRGDTSERARSDVAVPNTSGCGRSWETAVQGRNERDLKMLSD